MLMLSTYTQLQPSSEIMHLVSSNCPPIHQSICLYALLCLNHLTSTFSNQRVYADNCADVVDPLLIQSRSKVTWGSGQYKTVLKKRGNFDSFLWLQFLKFWSSEPHHLFTTPRFISYIPCLRVALAGVTRHCLGAEGDTRQSRVTLAGPPSNKRCDGFIIPCLRVSLQKSPSNACCHMCIVG